MYHFAVASTASAGQNEEPRIIVENQLELPWLRQSTNLGGDPARLDQGPVSSSRYRPETQVTEAFRVVRSCYACVCWGTDATPRCAPLVTGRSPALPHLSQTRPLGKSRLH